MLRPRETITTTCDSFNRLSRLLQKEDVKNLVPLSPDLIDVTFSKKSYKPNLASNIPIAAYILGHARIHLDKKWLEIKEKYPSASQIMCQSDAIIFSTNQEDSKKKFPLSSDAGNWKSVLGEDSIITDFFALHPAAYHINFQSNGSTYQQTKVSGFQLQNALLNQKIETQDFEKLLKGNLEGHCVKVPLMQIKRSSDGKSEVVQKNLSGKVKFKRILFENFKSVPFGAEKNLFTSSKAAQHNKNQNDSNAC